MLGQVPAQQDSAQAPAQPSAGCGADGNGQRCSRPGESSPAAACFFLSAGSSIITVMSAAIWCVGPSADLVLLHDGAAIGRDRRHGDAATGANRFLRSSAAAMKGASSACFFASARFLVGFQDRHDLRREQIERVADVLVLVAPALLDEDAPGRHRRPGRRAGARSARQACRCRCPGPRLAACPSPPRSAARRR